MYKMFEYTYFIILLKQNKVSKIDKKLHNTIYCDNYISVLISVLWKLTIENNNKYLHTNKLYFIL